MMTYRGSGSGSGSGYSGGGYYGSESSNRLSSSSTLPSTDFPQTPASTDDYFGPRRSAGGGHSTHSSHMDSKPKTPTSLVGRSVGGQFASSPPRRMTLSSSEAPRLETTLDSTSFEEMFSGFDVNKPTGIEELSPTAPKLATSLLPPSNPEGNGNGYNQPTSPASPMKKSGRVELRGPLPPPKSYNPAAVAPKVAGIVKEKVQTFNTYSKPQNMYSTDATGGTERWAGRPSEEGLISPTTVEDNPPRSISPRQSRNLTHSTPTAPSHNRKDSLTAPPRNTRLPRTPTGDLGLKRSSAVMKRHSIHTDEEDAVVTINNVQKPHGPRGITDRMKDRDSGWEETVASGSSSVNSMRDTASSASSRETGQTSVTSPRSPVASRQNTDENLKTITTIRLIDSTHTEQRPGVELRDGSDTELDDSMSAAAAIAAKFENEPTEKTKAGPKKVMTKAQFEKYRQQQDEERRLRVGPAKSDSESEDESEEDYDSDTERNKEVIRQRAKQEAHLSVYRQQMMKISGTTASTEALTNHAAPMLALNNSMPQLSISGADPDSDEDEEVPLGILLAHGFPSKNRPPTRLSNSSSQPNLRGVAQQQGMGGGRLPVFARNLPADPYNYGAGLINHTNRMPIGMGGGVTGLGGGVNQSPSGSVYGGSVYGGASELGRHPGGLIGEIAMAEEMKAARKHGGYPRPSTMGNRSPGTGGGMLGLGGGMPSRAMGSGMGMNGMSQYAPSMMGMPAGVQTPPRLGMPPANPMMGMPPPMSGMDLSQVQMQQQMQHMMQMQMQWMQQMQAQQHMMHGGLNPGAMGMPRPNSVAIPQVPARLDPTMQQRTMSMVDPMLASFSSQIRSPGYAPSIAPSMKPPQMMGLPQPGYTPSIAPSERNTIGMPSRYRPVTQVQPGNSSRSSTMTSITGSNWQQQLAKPVAGSALKTAMTKDDDDDDDSAWEEMKRKKEAKQDGWKKKKDLKSMLSFGGGSAATVTSS